MQMATEKRSVIWDEMVSWLGSRSIVCLSGILRPMKGGKDDFTLKMPCYFPD
jgi:hypothetical protein